MISPTEIVRGTAAKVSNQPLQNASVSGGFLKAIPPTTVPLQNMFPKTASVLAWSAVWTAAWLPVFTNVLNNTWANNSQMQQIQKQAQVPAKAQDIMNKQQIRKTQTQPAIQPNIPQTITQTIQQPETQPATDISTAVSYERLPDGTTVSKMPSIGEAYKTDSKEAMKLSDKAYKMINEAVSKWNQVDESTRKQVVDRLAEISWNPEIAQQAMYFLWKRFDEKWMDEVWMSQEIVNQNQQMTDKILAMDDATILKATKISSLPASVRNAVVNSEQYKKAIKKQNDIEVAKRINAAVSWTQEKLQKPVTTEESVKESLGVKDPKWVIAEEIKSISNDDRLTTLSWDVATLDDEIAKLQQEATNLKTNIEKEFPTSISKSALNAIIYDRQIWINNQLQEKLATRQAKVADYERVRQEKELAIQRKLEQQKQTMDFLTSWNWQALFWTSVEELKNMESNGTLPEWYSSMYQNYMEWMIYNTLAQTWSPNWDDMAVIGNALSSWYTPQQILANMSQMPKFQQSANMDLITKTVSSDWRAYQFNPATGLFDIAVWQPIAWQTSAGYPEITDSTFDLYKQRPNDYPGNTWADFQAPKWTPIAAPIWGTVTWISTVTWGALRVTMNTEDGKKITFDHVDPTTIKHILWDQEFTGNNSVNIPVSAGETIWFVGNTWNVKTMDPSTNEWVWVRKDWKLLRPDLAHKWTHASITVYDSNGKAYSVPETDKAIKQYAASYKDLSRYWSIISDYMEWWKVPSKDVLSAMWVDTNQFLQLATSAYVKMNKDQYANNGFDITDPGTLSRLTPAERTALNADISKAKDIQQWFDTLLDLVKVHWSESYWDISKQMSKIYWDLSLKAKDSYWLWVLNWPDLPLIERVLWTDPSSLSWAFKRKSTLIKGIEDAKEIFKNSIAAKASVYWITYNPEAATQRQLLEKQNKITQNNSEFADFNAQYMQ